MTDQQIREAMWSLMLADNLGDVHDVLNRMAQHLGFTLEGDYLDGWTKADKRNTQGGKR